MSVATAGIAAVILAGGASRRMGRDKAWLPWEGRPLLAHVVTSLATRCDPVIVVGAQGQDLPPAPEATVLRDPPDHPAEGPLRGLAVGLWEIERAGVELAFLSGCDAPFVSPAHVDALARALAPDAQAVAPVSEGRRQVLSSVVRVGPVRAILGDLLDGGTRSLQALFDTITVTVVEPGTLPDVRALRTCNTPDEIAALRALASPR